MGQYWKILCVDRNEALLIWAKLGEFFPGGYAGHQLEQQLMVPWALQEALFQMNGDRESSRNKRMKFTAPSVSGEVQRLFEERLGQWANHRIVCVGDYAESFPDSLKDLSGSVDQLYNLDVAETYPIAHFADELLNLQRLPAEKAAFEKAYTFVQRMAFPPEHQHALVNFTTKEFVRDKFMSSPMRIGLKYVREETVWGLGDAAMLNICWSDGSSTSLADGDAVNVQGRWAGHRMAIVSMVVFKKMTTGGTGWTDLTASVHRELADIWRSEDLY